MFTAVITIAHGRHGHLLRQYEALAESLVAPDHVILVAMDDPELSMLPFDTITPRIVTIPPSSNGLPLAAARNAGATAALAAGADVLIFLDVDCLPSPELIGSYVDAASADRWSTSILCGPVAYLPPPPPDGYDLSALASLAEPHPARPAPAPGEIVAGDNPALFWSLSFAVTAATWRRIGGFSEIYEGYGAEDTDFAMTATQADVALAWVGGARAFHQFHPTSKPPVQHLDDIVRNATLYFERWGVWPMDGWLREFERMDLVRWDDSSLSRK